MTVSNLTTIDRLFYCKCAGCDLYNLDPRNLVVHFATNDRSSLTKHRKGAHAYILRLRAPYKDAWTFEFVYYNTPPSPGGTSASATTGNATSRAFEAESAEEPNPPKDKRSKSSLPRETAIGDKYERVGVEPPDATGPVPVPRVSRTPRLSRPTKNVTPNAHGKGHAEPMDWLQQHVGRSQFLGLMDRRQTWSCARDWHRQHYANRRQRKGFFDSFNGQLCTRKAPVRRPRL